MSLSVLITYHNEGPWLTECIETVRHQPGAPDEILVYDDASSDPASDHAPGGVRIIRGEVNVGPARARNILLEQATGDFVHFHDADDWFAPEWCTQIRKGMRRADVIMTDVGIAGDRTQANVMNLASMEDHLTFAIRGAVLIPSMTYKKEVAPRFDESLHQSEDWHYHVTLLHKVPRSQILKLATDLVYVRSHENNRSKDTTRVWADAVKAIDNLQLNPRYNGDLAQKALIAAQNLYEQGEKEQARRAFDVARKFARDGRVPFSSGAMRFLSGVFGPMGALALRRTLRR